MVLKNETQGNYVIVSQAIMHDQSLRLFDRGLLVTLMSLPDNWKFSINGLSKIICDGRDAISSGLKRLEESGYLVNEQLRVDGKFSEKCLRINVSPNRRVSNEVAPDAATPKDKKEEESISKSPVQDTADSEKSMTENPIPDKPSTEMPSTEMPSTGKPLSGIPAQLNNKESIIQKSNIQESNNHRSNIRGYVTPVAKGEKHGSDNGTGNGSNIERPVRHTKSEGFGWTKDEIDLYGL